MSARRKMPRQKPGESEQTVETPPEFLAAVVRRFGPLTWDLAATVDNRKARYCYTPEMNSLAQNWAAPKHRGNLWLNPPFGDINPWAARCASMLSLIKADQNRSNRHDWRILMLVPASVGTGWYLRHIHGVALMLPLMPRLTFVGHAQSFPKDLALVVYSTDLAPGLQPWRWD